MSEIERRFSGREKAVAWILGIGGRVAGEKEKGHVPTEHLEVVHSLDRAGVHSIGTHVLDIHPDAIGLARQAIQDGHIDLKEFLPDLPKKDPWFKTVNDRRKYIRRLTGTIPKNGETYRLPIPEKLARGIKLHGPGNAGDIFLTEPAERPDVITCFNLAHFFPEEQQRELARKLAGALEQGGLILTRHQWIEGKTDSREETPFLKELAIHLGKAKPLAEIEIGESMGWPVMERVLCFEKKGA